MTGKRRWMGLLGVLAIAAGASMIVAAYSVAGTRAKAAPKQSQAFGTL
jgi:ABC-type nickel/cobalt efflux system permease component RcnA